MSYKYEEYGAVRVRVVAGTASPAPESSIRGTAMLVLSACCVVALTAFLAVPSPGVAPAATVDAATAAAAATAASATEVVEVAEIPSWAAIDSLYSNCECAVVANASSCAAVSNATASTEADELYSCAVTNAPCFDYPGTLIEANATEGFCRYVNGTDACEGGDVHCLHGGVCLDDANGAGTWQCRCRPGWGGELCEQVLLSNYVVYFTVDREVFKFDPIKIRFIGEEGDVSSQHLLTDKGLQPGANVTFSLMARDIGDLKSVQLACRPGYRYGMEVSDFNVAVGTDIYHLDHLAVDGYPGTILELELLPEVS